MSKPTRKLSTIQDFSRQRQRAIVQELFGVLTRTPLHLLPYDEIREKLHVRETNRRHLEDIQLDRIVGSVGRYRDFTRSFLPRTSATEERWVNIKGLADTMQGWPPIEVYQVGDVYFVKDGNHRVSVANEMGMKNIQAYVTTCETPVSLSPDTTPADLIMIADEANFLELTQLDKLRPEHSIEFTLPGQYSNLLAHIAAHQYYVENETGIPLVWEDAVTGWYDNVYVPIVRQIEDKELLRDFPHRTPADLYAWAGLHKLELRRACQHSEIDDGLAIDDYTARHSERPIRSAVLFIRRLFGRDQKQCPETDIPVDSTIG